MVSHFHLFPCEMSHQELSELEEGAEGGEDDEDFAEDMFGDEDLDLHTRYALLLG